MKNLIELGDCREIRIANGKVIYDDDTIKLVCLVGDLKVVRYLAWFELECSQWSIVIRDDEAIKILDELGVKFVAYDESPMIA